MMRILSLLLFSFLFFSLFCSVSSSETCKSFKCEGDVNKPVVGNPDKVCSTAECTSAECYCIAEVGKCTEFNPADCGSGYTIKSTLPNTECERGLEPGPCTITQCCDASSGCSTTPTCTGDKCFCTAGQYYDTSCKACPIGQYNNREGQMATSQKEIEDFFDERIVLTSPERAKTIDGGDDAAEKIKIASKLLLRQCELLFAVSRTVCEAYGIHEVVLSKICETTEADKVQHPSLKEACENLQKKSAESIESNHAALFMML